MPLTTDMTDDPLLTPEEVMDYLQLNLKTVYRLVNTGKLPAVRVGRQWRFRQSAIDAALSSSRDVTETGPADSSHVLVVDDEEPVRNLVATMLKTFSASIDVTLAQDGPSALDTLRQKPVSLLITDLRMPGMEGIALIREARKNIPRLPVVIITGRSREEDAIAAIDLGVAGYLSKPFELTSMLAVVSRALQKP